MPARLAAPPKVAIVVVNWNNIVATERALAALRRLDYPHHEIIIVDNGSREPLPEAAPFVGAGMRLIRSPTNLGYSGGNNLAIRAALATGAAYVWLFNNDATCPPDTLSRLVAACEADARLGLVSPLIVDADGIGVQVGCGRLDRALPAYEPIYDLDGARALHASGDPDITLTGAALLVRRAVIERIGLLDEAMFAYWEDIDYSIRAIDAGFRTAIVFEATTLHAAKDTHRDPDGAGPHYYYYMARNEFRLWARHATWLGRLRAFRWATARALRMAGRLRTSQRIEATLVGLWDGWRGRGGAYDPARRLPWLLGAWIAPASLRPQLVTTLYDRSSSAVR